VDPRQLRLPTVLIADASMFLAGAGLYLLMTLASLRSTFAEAVMANERKGESDDQEL